jgi:hypothetical protein
LKEKDGECAACLQYSVLIFLEKIYKMQHLEGKGTPVVYIGRTVLLRLRPAVEFVDESRFLGYNVVCNLVSGFESFKKSSLFRNVRFNDRTT